MRCYLFLEIFAFEIALFKLESLVFQVKVGVSLFELKSMGVKPGKI